MIQLNPAIPDLRVTEIRQLRILNPGPFKSFLLISYIGNTKNPPITDELCWSLVRYCGVSLYNDWWWSSSIWCSPAEHVFIKCCKEFLDASSHLYIRFFLFVWPSVRLSICPYRSNTERTAEKPNSSPKNHGGHILILKFTHSLPSSWKSEWLLLLLCFFFCTGP